MNERIRELVEQSGIHFYKQSVLDKHYPELYDGVYCELSVEELEKFAELLEKEFFSAGYLAGKSDGTMETIQECANFLADSLDDHFASEQLREHFGVES